MIDQSQHVDPEIRKTFLALGATRAYVGWCDDCHAGSTTTWVAEDMHVIHDQCDLCGKVWFPFA